MNTNISSCFLVGFCLLAGMLFFMIGRLAFAGQGSGLVPMRELDVNRNKTLMFAEAREEVVRKYKRQKRRFKDLAVDIWVQGRTCDGTTLFADYHDPEHPRIVEVDMAGKIVWEYVLPDELKRYTNPGFDVEKLSNDNVLFVAPLKGVFEIDRKGNIVWAYRNRKVSHDADRLPNGNTLVVFGGRDQKTDAQIKEVNPDGKIVWSWYAKDHFDKPPYNEIYLDGWTHANSVTRMSNGHTLVSLRNFNLVAELDKKGNVVRMVSMEGIGKHPHEPEIQSNGNILVCLRDKPWDKVVEIEPDTGKIIWEFQPRGLKLTRDSDRLPNGNILIVDRTHIYEITPAKEVVWRLTLGAVSGEKSNLKKFLYKAERIPSK